MKNLSVRARLLVASLVLVSAVCAAGALCPVDVKERPVANAHVSAGSGNITAVITPLPDEVSNGTWSVLDASQSTDTTGFIIEYRWDIVHKGVTTTTTSKTETFKFRELGLYKINLTVTDNNGNSSSAFTAVYSIVDADMDSLPDWWEMKYFLNLNQTASGDPDHDGYTNIEEYARGTNPIIGNSQPGLVEELADNWMYLVAIAAAAAVALVIMIPRMKRKRKAEVNKKIEAALEIERELESEK